MSTLRQSIDNILKTGTKIVSFNYDGINRNVLVGSLEASTGDPVWGEQINRAIRVHKGKEYLVALCNNDQDNGIGDRPIKAFELSKISSPSF